MSTWLLRKVRKQRAVEIPGKSGNLRSMALVAGGRGEQESCKELKTENGATTEQYLSLGSLAQGR